MSACDDVTVHEIIKFENGIRIDADQAWRKLTRSQFPGDPARGFSELTQNAVDSYSSATPWEDRWLKIETGDHDVAITDFGEGMSLERLRLLVTLGGTDKAGDPDKLGRFGLGFVAIFNPALGTRKVRVTTKCQDTYVELVLDVHDAERRPELSARVMDEASFHFGTRIEVTFDRADSAQECLEYALRSLTYFPCKATINGHTHPSVWDDARQSGNMHCFAEGSCQGIIEDWHRAEAVVLSKYDYVGAWPLPNLIAGSSRYASPLQALYNSSCPCVNDVRVTINCNDLTVTISRDRFLLDYKYRDMMKVMGNALADYLHKRLSAHPNTQSILANQYVLRNELARCVGGDTEPAGKDRPAMNHLVHLLAEAPVYRISGRRQRLSLLDIQHMRSEGLPVFFSPRQTNVRWLGGEFKNDGVILPTLCKGARIADFYDALFGKVFGDVVNLDVIQSDHSKIADLASRGVVSKRALRPTCAFRGWRDLTSREQAFLKDINKVLICPAVREAITRNLHMEVSSIKTGFIDVDESGVTIATGLFNRRGRVLSDVEELEAAEFTNLSQSAEHEARRRPVSGIRLGLRRDHPVIDSLISSSNPHRQHYALTFLAHELVRCQRRLIPYSRFFHWVKERMAADMREALLRQLAGG